MALLHGMVSGFCPDWRRFLQFSGTKGVVSLPFEGTHQTGASVAGHVAPCSSLVLE